jgi:hypothetical protein
LKNQRSRVFSNWQIKNGVLYQKGLDMGNERVYKMAVPLICALGIVAGIL